MTNWELWIKRRNENIGFITRNGGFQPPTPAEIASAKALEINAWQRTKGTVPYKIGQEYKTPLGHGINLLRTREPGGKLDGPEYQSALSSYVLTPMDHHGILKAHGIDVTKYEVPTPIYKKIFHKIKDWFHRNDEDYTPPNRTRLTKEFIDSMTTKEKK